MSDNALLMIIKRTKKIQYTCVCPNYFPWGTYAEIVEFLTDFDIMHKIPGDLNTVVSKNERGCSPGELQIIVVASQIWKAIKIKSPFLLLDEIERNIDFETVKKMFDKILSVYFGTIILITHLPDLKKYLKKHIGQTWHYPGIQNGELTFTIEKNLTQC